MNHTAPTKLPVEWLLETSSNDRVEKANRDFAERFGWTNMRREDLAKRRKKMETADKLQKVRDVIAILTSDYTGASWEAGEPK